MPMFYFHISGQKPFESEGVELPSKEAAWQEALQLIRDVEGTMRPGESWILDVSDGTSPVFRISIAGHDFRNN
jgi:hypothetical protein